MLAPALWYSCRPLPLALTFACNVGEHLFGCVGSSCEARLPRGGALGAAQKGHFRVRHFGRVFMFTVVRACAALVTAAVCVEGACFSACFLVCMCHDLSSKIAFQVLKTAKFFSPPAAGGLRPPDPPRSLFAVCPDTLRVDSAVRGNGRAQD